MRSTRPLVIVGIMVAAVCTACGSQSSPTAAPSPTVHHSKVPATSPSAGSTTQTVAQCRTSDLKLSLGHSEGTAGSVYVDLVLTNTSTRTCVTGGFGGVSYVGNGNGTQVGAPAVRQGSPGKVRLAPGERAVATLQETEAGNYDAATCQPMKVDGLRVYPPNQTASLYVAQPTTGCKSAKVHLLTIQPYHHS